MAKERHWPTAAEAGAVLAMHDNLESGRSIARKTAIPESTVYDIINSHGHWGEWVTGPIARQHREEQKSILAKASRTLAAKCLEQVDKMLPKASAYQAAGIYGLMRTHERLDMGESTDNISIIAKVDAGNADGLAQRLAARMVTSGSQPTDITSDGIR